MQFPRNEAKCGGTYSAVYKDAVYARAIFNLRYLNQFCNEKEVLFQLLRAAQLIARLRAIDFSRGLYRIVTAMSQICTTSCGGYRPLNDHSLPVLDDENLE